MIMHVVGNRPQFIKLAPLMRELNRRNYSGIIIHTGQHYDENMSDIFFSELGIEPPYKNLHIGSGTHAETTGKALIELEKVMLEEKPEVVIVYGDTNTTLAAALAAAKLGIPIVHVEAGPRTYERNNPEEINRKIVDHLSSLLCCPDAESVNNLKKEGICENVYFTGDIMYDTFLYSKNHGNAKIYEKYGLQEKEYAFMTWHRQENTSDCVRMKKILDFIEKINVQVICPLHPRTKGMLDVYGLTDRVKDIQNLNIVEPLGYMDTVSLMNHCKFIVCDSGGVSKESFYAGVKCFFMLDFNPWKNLVKDGHIVTLDFDDEICMNRVVEEINCMEENCIDGTYSYFGNGNAASEIVNLMIGKGYLGVEE